MSLNTGTLVGAPIRPNDSLDNYASAIADEIMGGLHIAASVAAMNAIKTSLLEWGMLCYVQADGNIYQLAEDLVTWNLLIGAGGGTTGPGSGGDSSNTTIISGNFGIWTPLTSYSASIVDEITLSYKTDLAAFTGRQITYLQGQFSLNADFTGTSITLGVLPANNCPSAAIKKYMIVENIEMYLTIDTAGNVGLLSKDGDNLPTGNTDAPYYIDTFFKPVITAGEPETYSYTRTESFTRSNCKSGFAGSAVNYSQTYTSTVSLAAATALAMADSTYEASGQAYANNAANGATCTVSGPAASLVIDNDNTAIIIQSVTLEGPENYSVGEVGTLVEVDQNIGDYTYSTVSVKTGSGGSRSVTCNGETQTSSVSGELFVFNNVTTPIQITLNGTGVAVPPAN